MIINSFGGGASGELGMFKLRPGMVIWNDGIQSGLTAGKAVNICGTYLNGDYIDTYRNYINMPTYNIYGSWLLICRELLDFTGVRNKTITGDLHWSSTYAMTDSYNIVFCFVITSTRSNQCGSPWTLVNSDSGSNRAYGYYDDCSRYSNYAGTLLNIDERGDAWTLSSTTVPANKGPGIVGQLSFTIPTTATFGYLGVAGFRNQSSTVWLGLNNVKISS